jgi:hypothetical protein
MLFFSRVCHRSPVGIASGGTASEKRFAAVDGVVVSVIKNAYNLSFRIANRRILI